MESGRRHANYLHVRDYNSRSRTEEVPVENLTPSTFSNQAITTVDQALRKSLLKTLLPLPFQIKPTTSTIHHN
jgi:hypothetical protein